MKKFRKIFAILLAAAMVMTLNMAAFAEDTATTGTITITPPSGVLASSTNTYKIYKVFDAAGNGSAISYKLVDGKTEAPAGFVIDTAGNVIHGTKAADGTITPSTATELTDAEIDAIAAYITEADLVDTATSTGTAAAVSKALPNGYYYITTSTGTVVTIDSTNPTASVEDKNVIPVLTKAAKQAEDPSYIELDAAGANAIAQVGKKIPYEITIKVGKGAKGYVFHDKMDAGLAYQGDIKIEVETADITEDTSKVSTATASGDTITATFVDDYLKTIEGKTITITYSAVVSSAALSVTPATNTAKLNYGDQSGYVTDETSVNVYNAKMTVTKKDGENQPLAGAGFVIAVAASTEDATEGDSTIPAEDNSEDGNQDTEGTDAAADSSYKYYKLENNVVTWVDDINDATEYTSDATGAVPAFTGLGPGSYILIEKTVPAGYNKAADQTFEVTATDYTTTNLEQTAEVTNNAGSTLPSTGGIGTTIFYIVGGILVIGAGVVMITRRRMDAQ